MKISTRVQYGTQLMIYLGLYYGKGSVFLKDIAKMENISEKYLSQIIIALKSAGLVHSFRGAHGGYSLAIKPSEITLKEIVEVLEGDLSFVNGKPISSESPRASAYVTRNLWDAVGDRITEMLDSVTLETLVRQCREKQENAVQYNI